MELNPLFFNMNQSLPELSQSGKFGGISYLFSDIIKVFLNESGQNGEQKIPASPEGEINSLVNAFKTAGGNTPDEKTITEAPGKKWKLSLDEISDSSVQKVFAGIANALLQTGNEVAVKKSSGNSMRKIELNSSVPEDEVVKTFSLFVEQIAENFGLPETEKASFNMPFMKDSGTVQMPVSPELKQNPLENTGETPSAEGTKSIKFKLETAGESLTMELIKPEQETTADAGNKNINVFNSFPEPEKKEFKLQINYSIIPNEEPVPAITGTMKEIIDGKNFYKEPAALKSIYPAELKIEGGDSAVKKSDSAPVIEEIKDVKSAITENTAEENNKSSLQSTGKFFSKEIEIPKAIYREDSNFEKENKFTASNNETENPKSINRESTNPGQEDKFIPSNKIVKEETGILKSILPEASDTGQENKPAPSYKNKETGTPKTIYPSNRIDAKDANDPVINKKVSSLNTNKVNIPDINSLKNEVRLKIAIEPKEAPQNQLKPQYREIRNDASIIHNPGEVIDPAPLNSVKGTVILSLEISKDKEIPGKPNKIDSLQANENDENKFIINDENNKLEITDKNSAGNQNQSSDQPKHDAASVITKSKIEDPLSLNQGKEFSSNMNNELSRVKETVQKGNSPLPSFSSEASKIINYSNLNEEISGIIREHEVKSVVLKLQPEELGKVRVVLDMMNNGIKANIEVSNDAVRQTVQSNIEQLKANLMQQGIQLSSLNVTLNNEQKPNKAFEQKKQRYAENNSGDETVRVETRGSTSKKLGYNTYEYLI